MQLAWSPAMDHDGSVSSPPLYHQHLLNDCHDGRRGCQVCTSLPQSLWSSNRGCQVCTSLRQSLWSLNRG